ncbi:MAG TPA: CBS domain-containing protein [Polyangiaceae bacterium]|nr:CBS domain-containing protein [Polyangiaceae bacterium]
MSLESYRRSRLVVQNPRTPIYEAVRAMESNHIGFVIVQDKGRVVGVLTDRDVAMRVVAPERDFNTTRLEHVMTRNPVVLSIDADEREALRLMRERRVRRIPLVEDGGGVVGLVTLDDLLLSQRVDPRAVAEVVRAQLAEASELKPEGVVHPIRPTRPEVGPSPEQRAQAHETRQRQTTLSAARVVQDATGLETPESALTALDILVSAIVRRLPPGEARDFISQLPSEFHDHWLDLPAGPDRSITRANIEAEIAERLALDYEGAAKLTEAVGHALERLLSAGQIAQARALLPEGGLRELLPEPSRASARTNGSPSVRETPR